MTDLDRVICHRQITELSQSVASLREKYKPYSGADVNLKLYNALGVAQDQLEYSAHLLQQREPDPRQVGIFETSREGDVVKGVIITELPSTSLANWCEGCQNPKLACTCPGRRR